MSNWFDKICTYSHRPFIIAINQDQEIGKLFVLIQSGKFNFSEILFLNISSTIFFNFHYKKITKDHNLNYGKKARSALL